MFDCANLRHRVMTRTKINYLTKYAMAETRMTPLNVLNGIRRSPSAVGVAAAGLTSLPFVPWNSASTGIHELNGTANNGEAGRSMSKDVGRTLGAALGAGATMGLREAWHIPSHNPLLNMALLLGGTGIGATLGQMKGRSVGDELFPGTLTDRLRRSISKF